MNLLKGNSIQDFLVISDMDGTLLTTNNELPAANLETIRLFKSLGGRFTVATGRVHSAVTIYPELTETLDPGITSGGCVVYDFKQRKALKNITMQRHVARRALQDILSAFPELGAMVMASDMRIYQLAASKAQEKLVSDEKMIFFVRPTEDLPEDWNKILFAAEPDALAAVEKFVQTRTYPGLHFVWSNDTYFEMFPKGVTKGSALQNVCNLAGVHPSKTIVIGDYYNDIKIMRQAGYSAAVANAPSEVQALANEVIPSNDEAGVAQFLYKLINRFTT